MVSIGTVILTDPAGEQLPLRVRVHATEHQVLMQPAGFGEPEATEGTGYPLFRDFHSGRLRLVVFPDINDPEPVIIPLDQARESLRRSGPD